MALNEAVAKAAAKFKMPFIDMYGVSSAGGRSTWADDHVHYYHEKQKCAGHTHLICRPRVAARECTLRVLYVLLQNLIRQHLLLQVRGRRRISTVRAGRALGWRKHGRTLTNNV